MASSISDRRRCARGASRLALAVLPLVALPLLLCAGAARAEVSASAPKAALEAAREAARALLVDGVDLLRKGQYAPALIKFEQAYALVPSPNIHYNRALAYVGLGRNAEALEAFETFLAQADHAPPGTREKAGRDRESLRARVATVAVTSDPRGADVTIDGRARGVTPLGGSLYLDPGPHEVAARNPATGAAATERITALPGQTLSLTLRLAPADIARARAPQSVPEPGRAQAWQTAPPAAGAREIGGAPEERAGLTANPWALSAAGLGVALLGAGVTFAFLVDREENRVHDASMVANGSTDPNKNQFKGGPQTNESNGLKYQTLEAVFLTAGAAALTTGVVLYLLKRRTEPRAARDAMTSAPSGPRFSGGPIVAPTLAGARLQLSF